MAYGLIALFCGLPFVKIGGMPAILLNIPERRFTLFGTTFLATDTLLLMLAALSLLLGVFLLTALFGRIWCGWACPQTVYMEFVFRPLERLIEGGRGNVERGMKKPTGGRRALKIFAFLLVSLFLAHVFLSYFVGMGPLLSWMTGAPTEHWSSFVLVAVVTAAMLFDFIIFREQTCLVACPYGRFQSVLLDRSSLIVGYDEKRGEPRGKGKRTEGTNLGDCVDCQKCVVTCPTGIDIRKGLQMECIHCTQCIDACDAVMDKIGKPRGLIRYSSQDELIGKGRRFLRPRTILYPLLMTIVLGLFVTALVTKSTTDLTVLRAPGPPMQKIEDGRIMNRMKIRIVNRDSVPRSYRITIPGVANLELVGTTETEELATNETLDLPIALRFPAGEVGPTGERVVEVTVINDAGTTVTHPFTMLAPRGSERSPE